MLSLSLPVRLRRRVPVLFAVLAVAAALVAVVQLRRRAPPEPARLLPGADGFLYINLKWLRTLKAIGQLPPVPRDPDYERFIQETGFQFERDLDEAAFAVHYPASWGIGATGGSAPRPRLSEVFVGRIEGQRLSAYLRKIATAVETYHSADIYTIPYEDATFRVAVLNVDSVAVSNHDDPAVIRGIVDRSHKLASPFGGPALLRQYYKSLPVLSKTLPVVRLAWFIGRVQPSNELGAWSVLFQKPATVVVSAFYPLYSPTLHLRAEAHTGNSVEAQRLTDQVSTYLALFHAAELAVATHGTDPDVKAFFDSLNVQSNGDRAVVTAVIPPAFLRKVVEEPPEPASAGPSAGPEPNSPPPKSASRRKTN